LYTKSIDNKYMIISLYVNNMFVFCTSMNVMYNIKHFLASKFDKKDMAKVSVILDIEIIRRDNGIMLTQEHHVEKHIKKFGHFYMTPVSSPYDVNTQLKKNKDKVIAQLKYARIIGSLMHTMCVDINQISIVSIGQR